MIDKIYADFSTVLRAPDVKQKLDEMAIDTTPKGREEFDQFIRDELARWAKVIRERNIRAQ